MWCFWGDIRDQVRYSVLPEDFFFGRLDFVDLWSCLALLGDLFLDLLVFSGHRRLWWLFSDLLVLFFVVVGRLFPAYPAIWSPVVLPSPPRIRYAVTVCISQPIIVPVVPQSPRQLLSPADSGGGDWPDFDSDFSPAT